MNYYGSEPSPYKSVGTWAGPSSDDKINPNIFKTIKSSFERNDLMAKKTKHDVIDYGVSKNATGMSQIFSPYRIHKFPYTTPTPKNIYYTEQEENGRNPVLLQSIKNRYIPVAGTTYLQSDKIPIKPVVDSRLAPYNKTIY